MKKLYAILAGITLFTQSYAKPIDVNTAKTIGYSFLSRNTDVTLPNGANDLQVAYTATSDINGASTPCYYVFNASKGFVIISADDNVLPVLGFSNESPFVTTNIPSHVQWWMNNYTKQIAFVIQNNVAASAGIADQWKTLASSGLTPLAKTTNVSPLITTLWDQLPRYNNLCPGTGSNQSVTGCVATAMAQVMKFWNWPAVGSGANAYIPDTVVSYGVQSANFGATAYQWSSMPTQLSSTTSSTQNTAVATLMYQCGVAVNMNYNTAANDGSGAYVETIQSLRTNCAEFALKNYFKYSPQLHGDLRANYANTTAWVNALETDLNAGRPVLYTGFGSDGGHCWVADGYQVSGSSTTFHFNWGWSGQSNGYFTVDNLAPPALGAGGGNGNFNSDQGAVFNIHPISLTANSNTIKLNAPISVPNVVTGYTQLDTIAANIINNSGSSFAGDVAAEVFDLKGNLITTIAATSSVTIANNATSGTLIFPATKTNAGLMVPGIYVIHIVYKPTGSNNWSLVGDNGNYINYATTAVDDFEVIALYDSIQCSGGRILTNGQPITVNTQIANLSGSDFTGTVDASLWDPTTLAQVFEIQQVANTTIPASSAVSATFTSTNNLNVPGGTYILLISAISGGQFVPLGSNYFSNPILVQVPNRVAVNNVASEKTIQIYPNPATDVININLNDATSAQISVMDMQGRVIKNVTANSNIVTITTQDIAPGIYMVQVRANGTVITQKIAITK